jgi:hypothetical protein
MSGDCHPPAISQWPGELSQSPDFKGSFAGSSLGTQGHTL